MEPTHLFQPVIWVTLLFLNLFLIWKYILKTKELKSTNSFDASKSNLNLQDSSAIYYFEKNQLHELFHLIEDIENESDLAKHTKIQQLVTFFQTRNFPVVKINGNSEKVDKPTLKRKKMKFKSKLFSYHSDLTDQEIQLCELILNEKTCNEIAETMILTTGTVRVYKTKLKLKLNLSQENSLYDYLSKLDEMN